LIYKIAAYSDKRVENDDDYEYLDFLEVMFAPIELRPLMKYAAISNMALFDDRTFEKSFIHDINFGSSLIAL